MSAPAASDHDHHVARSLAEMAGARLLELRQELLAAGHDARTVKDQGDLTSHEYLVDCLATEMPGDAVLSEEATNESADVVAARLAARRVWIVDPLDGTREYGEGRSDWAVHVALAVDGEPVCGAVALPALGESFATGQALTVPDDVPPVVVASRTRPPGWAAAAADAVGAELIGMGSAGAKAMEVVAGRAVAYVHAGGMSDWDSCAPVAVALAAGLWVSQLDGSPLRFNTASRSTPELVICRPGLEGAILAAANGA
ncbi:MAG: inositol monophosphatase family protein [Actinomycetes bacterium]